MSQCSFPKGPYHGDPVSFSRAGGSKSHVWICVACRTQLSGPRLPDDERNALVDFAHLMRAEFEKKKQPGSNAGTLPTKGDNMSKEQTNAGAAKPRLEIAVLAGAESKAWLAGFTEQVDRLEKIANKMNTAPADDDEPTDDDEPATAGDNDDMPSTDDDGDFGSEAGEDDTADDDFDAPPAKKETKKAAPAAKAPKLTSKDVNNACKERAGRTNRAEVLGILKKKFKVTSVTELKPEQYADVIKAMKGK